MNMISVHSSNLRAVGYDPSAATLRISFHNGTYDYFGVPEHVYHNMMSASSKGEYHASFIKNRYSFSKIN